MKVVNYKMSKIKKVDLVVISGLSHKFRRHIFRKTQKSSRNFTQKLKVSRKSKRILPAQMKNDQNDVENFSL